MARVVLTLIAVNHVVIPAIALTHIADLQTAVRTAHPSYDSGAVTRMVGTILTTSLSVHVPLFILTAILVWKLPTGHPWVLRPATASQAFGIVFSGLSTAPLPALQTLFPIVDALQLTVIVLLWAPRSSREFFSAHPRSRRARRLRALLPTP